MRFSQKLMLGVSCMGIACALCEPAAAQAADVGAAAQAGEQASGASAGAQTAAPAVGLEEIVVTAQRRAENLQDVPISVAVATAAQLQAAGVASVTTLKMALPGVDVQRNNGYAIPVIRGIGSKGVAPGLEPPVAFYVDDVYIANQTSTLLSLNNIEQVEALKGPQGTLFGRNATAGLIQITTRDPSQDLSGKLDVSYGNYDTFRATAYLGGGVAPNLVGDLAATIGAMGKGYGQNLFTGQDVYKVDRDLGLRSKWIFTPGSATSFRLILDYTDQKNSNNATRLPRGSTAPAPFGPTYGGRHWDIATEQPLTRFKGGGASLRIDHDLDALRVASITAYRRSEAFIAFDADYTPTVGRYITLIQRDWQFSQELQLLSAPSSRVTWVAGAYYFAANSTYDPLNLYFKGVAAGPAPVSPVQIDTLSAHKTDSISGFGQATAEITEGLRFTAGLRYTSEKRTLADAVQIITQRNGGLVVVPFADREKRFNKLTWRLAVDYDINDDVLAYASYNRGFKSGGFNAGVLTIPFFNPEVLDSYEAGLKTNLFERRARFNVASFYYDYKDIQVQRNVNGATGLYNSGPAKIYGLEAEFEVRPARGLDLRATYQFIPHAEYRDFPAAVVAVPRAAGGYTLTTGPATGNRVALSPKHTLGLSADYTVELQSGQLGLNISYYYNGGYYHEPDNVTRQKSYNLVNGSIRYTSGDRWSATLWGNNLTNAVVANVDGIQSFGATGIRRASYAPPRTFGVTLGYSF